MDGCSQSKADWKNRGSLTCLAFSRANATQTTSRQRGKGASDKLGSYHIIYNAATIPTGNILRECRKADMAKRCLFPILCPL